MLLPRCRAMAVLILPSMPRLAVVGMPRDGCFRESRLFLLLGFFRKSFICKIRVLVTEEDIVASQITEEEIYMGVVSSREK